MWTKNGGHKLKLTQQNKHLTKPKIFKAAIFKDRKKCYVLHLVWNHNAIELQPLTNQLKCYTDTESQTVRII